MKQFQLVNNTSSTMSDTWATMAAGGQNRPAGSMATSQPSALSQAQQATQPPAQSLAQTLQPPSTMSASQANQAHRQKTQKTRLPPPSKV